MMDVGKEAARESNGGAALKDEDFFHVTLRDSRLFIRFRTQNMGAQGGIQRVAGQRPNESWADHEWLISKRLAHVENGYLVADDEATKKLLRRFGSVPRHIEGDLFKARPVARKPRVRH